MGGGVVEEASALAVGVPTWEGAALEQGRPHREPNTPAACEGSQPRKPRSGREMNSPATACFRICRPGHYRSDKSLGGTPPSHVLISVRYSPPTPTQGRGHIPNVPEGDGPGSGVFTRPTPHPCPSVVSSGRVSPCS